MALTSANQAASSTPAANLYTTLAALMSSAGWYEHSDSPISAIAAGNTGDSAENVVVRVWMNAATLGAATVFVYISVVDTVGQTPRLRFRCSETYQPVTTVASGGTCTTDVSADTFTKTSHGLVANQQVRFDTIVNTTGITANTWYWVISSGLTANVFKISATRGGAAVDLTGSNGSASAYTGGPIYPCPGMNSSSTFTPAADDSVNGNISTALYQSAGTNAITGYVDMFVSAAGFGYVMGANANEVVLATGTPSLGWMHCGRVVPADNLSPSSTVCFLGGRASSTGVNVGWTLSTTAGGNYRTSRQPNQGANSMTGPFCFYIGASAELIVPYNVSGAAGYGGQQGTAHKWLANQAAQVGYLHAAGNVRAEAAVRTHLCKLSNTAVTGWDTMVNVQGQATIGDTMTIGGVTYYLVGPTHLYTSGASGAVMYPRMMCIKSTAF